MTLLTNSFEGGTNGTAATVSNTGGASGDAFDGVVGAPVFDTSQFMHGTKSLRCVAGATANYGYWNVSSTDIAQHCYFFLAAPPTADYTMMRVDGTAGANAIAANVTSTGKIRLIQSGSTTLATGTTTIPAGTDIRLELRATQDAAAGNVSLAYFLGDSPTPVETIGSTTANTGSGAFTRSRFGKNATSGLDAVWIDDCATETVAAGAFIGPSVTVFAGDDVVDMEPWTIASLLGSATPADGTTIVSWLWTQTAGRTTTIIAPTSQNASAEILGTLAGDTATFSLVATDSNGVVSAPATVNFISLPVTDAVVLAGVLTPIKLMRA